MSYDLRVNLIYNKAMCQTQKQHQDYRKENLAKLSSGAAVPFTVFFGICPKSSLLVKTNNKWERINYGTGDVLFLAGDVIHAGPLYMEPNCRFQAFMDTQIRHDEGNTNEWISCEFEESSLFFEIKEGLYDAELFKSSVTKTKLQSLYGVSKDDIIKRYEKYFLKKEV